MITLIKIFQFFIVLFLLLGPKFGAIDLSIIVTYFFLCLTLIISPRIKKDKNIFFFIFFSFIILIYSTISIITNLTFDLQIFLKYFRSILVLILIYLILNFRYTNLDFLIKSVLFVIVFHTIFIYIEIIFPQIKVFIAPIVGYDKIMFPLRCFGLLNGFDNAGYFCLIGMIYFFWKIIHYENTFYNYFIFIFLFVATLFTSRNTIVFSVLLFIFLSIIILFKKNVVNKLVSVPVLILSLYAFFLYLLPIILFSLNSNVSLNSKINITSSYSNTSHSQLIDMVKLPEFSYILLGEGVDNKDIDIGFIKIIFMTGSVGLILNLVFYGILVFYCYKLYNKLKDQIFKVPNEIYFFWCFLVTIFIFYIWFNIKSLFIFSRGLNDMLFLLSFIFILKTKNFIQTLSTNGTVHNNSKL